MEFLDPKKQKQHLTRLFIGYFLVGVALILTVVILLYQANGFGFKNGQVIQNGLIFVSSTPTPADIYVNGQKNDARTNVRLLMPAGQYSFELRKEGYRPWKRAINIEGGAVARFDYPMLFPATITTAAVKRYPVQPGLATQSPDRRWVLVQSSAANTVFDLFELSKPEDAPRPMTISENVFALKTGTHSLKLVEWANDNTHILLQHVTDDGGKKNSEYVLLDRENPDQSINLTQKLGQNPTKLELRDKKYDKYLLYDAAAHALSQATLEQPQPAPLLNHVLGYKSHGDDVFLYATDQDAPTGKAIIKLRDGDKTYTIRQVDGGSAYMLDLARYENNWYVAAGAPNENRTYVYKNPAARLDAEPQQALVPVQVLKTANPTYIDFSDNARFIMAQGGQQFSVYDAETDKGYNYTVDKPMDAAQDHASWMDGHRLTFTSGAKTVVFDFDKTNQESLAAADPSYLPFFDRNYEVLYTLMPETTKDANGKDVTQFVFTSAQLRAPQDR
jgi:hypothetical protein